MESNSSIILPEDWANAANTIIDASATSPPIALICGAKNSGKSTFSRHLMNILLKRYKKVAYLDTDVGQTEFTPPGLLSLTVIDKITPDLMVPCMKTPDRCYFYGDISSKRDPNMYLKYIFALYDYYRKVYCAVSTDENNSNIEVPLVVNTPGWVKGIGYDLLVDMLKYICPTHVVKICISVESKNLPAGEFWLDGVYNPEVTHLIEVKSARQDSLQRSVLVQKDPHHLRDLRIMAYFRQCFPNDSPNTIKELARALAAHPPYEVSVSDFKIKYLHCKVPDSEYFYSLNVSIVGLAVSPDDAEQLPHCVGLGIIRSIDTRKRLLYIITPVLPNILENVDLLLRGLIQVPTCLLQVKGCISPYMCANVLPID